LAAAAICILAMSGAFLTGQTGISASASSERYESSLRQLNLDLIAASRAGYTEVELQPILDRQAELARVPAPVWPNDRQGYAQRRGAQIAGLRAALLGLELNRVELLRRTVTVRLGELNDGLARDARLGVEAGDLQPLRDSADMASRRLDLARTPADYNLVFSALGPALSEAEQLNAQQSAQLAAVETEAGIIRAKGLAAARATGARALAAGRNDATIAAYLNRPDLGRPLQKLESTAPRLASEDLNDVALAAALMESYRDQVHAAFLRITPPKLIVTSLAAQEMWVYWNGQLWLNTLVTTGRPALPTDVGLMVVARKESPVHMVSPFPKGSTYDYGTVDTRYALWFQPSGEAIHDSWWRSWYGPNSNQGDLGSHGCIGLPYGPIDKLFPWTDVGTPVVVIPGDGGTVASQVAQKTYDDPWWNYHQLGSQQAPAQAPSN